MGDQVAVVQDADEPDDGAVPVNHGECLKKRSVPSIAALPIIQPFNSYFVNYCSVFNRGRILKMMHTISTHAHENRMSSSVVAACMAPLLLRSLLAGDCELEDDFDINGDNYVQLLAAANANIFDVRSLSLIFSYLKISLCFENNILLDCVPATSDLRIKRKIHPILFLRC